MLKFQVFGSERRGKLSRKIKRIESKIARRLLIGIHKPRSIESYRGLKMCLLAIKPTIEDLTRGFLNKEAQWIEVTIDDLSRRQKVSQLIELAIESY